jgi:hypothetical protein
MLEIKKIWLIIFSLVVVLLLVVIAVLLFINFYPDQETSSTGTTSTTSKDYMIPLDVVLPNTQPVEQVDPTANWPVYEFKFVSSATSSEEMIDPANNDQATSSESDLSKEKTLFSFKYPEVFQVEKSENGVSLISEVAGGLRFDIAFEETELDLADVVKAIDETDSTTLAGKLAVENVFSSDESVVNDNPAIFRQQKLLDKNLGRYVLYLKSDNTFYSIHLTVSELNEELLSLFAVFVENFKINN